MNAVVRLNLQWHTFTSTNRTVWNYYARQLWVKHSRTTHILCLSPTQTPTSVVSSPSLPPSVARYNDISAATLLHRRRRVQVACTSRNRGQSIAIHISATAETRRKCNIACPRACDTECHIRHGVLCVSGGKCVRCRCERPHRPNASLVNFCRGYPCRPTKW